MKACKDEMNRELLGTQVRWLHSPILNFGEDSIVQLPDSEVR
jgi:hypothetical protein